MTLTFAEAARFWSRVEVRKEDQCWPWRYGLNDDGYGEYRPNEKTPQLAHRVAYALVHGELPSDSVIRHKCDNRSCCNPGHLVIGTHADNVRDRVERKRSAIGERHGRSKLTEVDVLHIRGSKLSPAFLAVHYGVDAKVIRDVRDGKTWRHLLGETTNGCEALPR